MRMGWKLILVVVLATGLLVAGCTGRRTSQHPFIGKPAPDFMLYDVDGKEVTLSDVKGKPVLINFWAVRCPPCREEMPLIQQVYEEYSTKGLAVLAINNAESQPTVKQFIESNKFTFTVLLDMDSQVADKFGVYPLPTTYFVDKNGIIQDVVVGAFQSKPDIERHLSKIMR